jgi:hypothetical protein
MKKKILPVIVAAVAGLAPAAFAEASKDDCATLSTKVQAEVGAKPDQVLVILAEKIAANPGCSCEIVKAAITAAKADKDLVGEIVFTAVSAAPAEATTIAECAVAASPESAETVKAALQRAMSDKNPVGKGVDKAPPPPVQDDLGDFGLSPVNIGGVYLVYPGGGAIGSRLSRDEDGNLILIGPDGSTIFVEEGAVEIVEGRPPRRPGPIIIVVPTPTQGTPQNG